MASVMLLPLFCWICVFSAKSTLYLCICRREHSVCKSCVARVPYTPPAGSAAPAPILILMIIIIMTIVINIIIITIIIIII